MFLMQHHRAKTRLLDWSENPLAALHFAADTSDNPKKEAAVWCLDPIALNREAHVRFEFDAEIPAFGHDQVLESYLPTHLHSDPTSELFPLAIVGPRNTSRMAAQRGTFTVNHRANHPIEEIGKCEHIWRWIIPVAARKKILAELALLGVTQLTLFPELDSVAKAWEGILP